MIPWYHDLQEVRQLPEPGIEIHQRLPALAHVANVPCVDEYVPGGHGHFAVQAMGIRHAHHEQGITAPN